MSGTRSGQSARPAANIGSIATQSEPDALNVRGARFIKRSIGAIREGNLIRRAKHIEQWALRILCAVALVFVGFAHQAPAAAAGAFDPAELAHYVLPDGTLPTLCVTVPDKSDTDKSGASQHDKAHSHGCEACRIGASTLLPTPTDMAGAPIGFAVSVELPIRAEAFHRQLFPPNTGPRAPPSDPIPA